MTDYALEDHRHVKLERGLKFIPLRVVVVSGNKLPGNSYDIWFKVPPAVRVSRIALRTASGTPFTTAGVFTLSGDRIVTYDLTELATETEVFMGLIAKAAGWSKITLTSDNADLLPAGEADGLIIGIYGAPA